MDLETQFMEAINRATEKWRKYKQDENAYKDEVNAAQIELKRLIDELKACIDRLMDLQDDYRSYIQRITQIRINMQAMLNQQIEVIRGSEEDCDEKINRIKQQFEGFVNEIQNWENDDLKFKELFEKLEVEIKRICDRADRLERENPETKRQFEREIKQTEDFLESQRQGRGASKKDADDERKEDVRQEAPQQQAQPENLPAGWRKERDPDSGRDYYFCEATGESTWIVPTGPCRAQQVAQKVDQPQVAQSRQQGEDFGQEFNCATHPKASFGKDLREHIIGKMVEFGFMGTDRGGTQESNQAAAEKLARYVDKLLTQPRCARVLKNLGYAKGSILANNLLRGMTVRQLKRNLIKGQDQRWRSADSSLGGGGRRTRKKRGGWQTPQKLESISRYSPIRRVERKKKKNKKKNTKKNKKRRRRKQTKRRRKKRN